MEHKDWVARMARKSDDCDDIAILCGVSLNLHRNPTPSYTVRFRSYVSEAELCAGDGQDGQSNEFLRIQLT
jgi:hypothetical protein